MCETFIVERKEVFFSMSYPMNRFGFRRAMLWALRQLFEQNLHIFECGIRISLHGSCHGGTKKKILWTCVKPKRNLKKILFKSFLLFPTFNSNKRNLCTYRNSILSRQLFRLTERQKKILVIKLHFSGVIQVQKVNEINGCHFNRNSLN